MKKLISILMTVVMVFGLAACGTTSSTNNTNTAESEDKGGGYSLSSLTFPAAVKCPNMEDFNQNGKYDYDGYNKAYSKWIEYTTEKDSLIQIFKGKLNDYFDISAEFLSGKEGENSVCSPVNIFFALAMLAETADGNTRTEILDVLGIQNMDELRSIAKALWEYHYSDDSITKLLGASLWINDSDSLVFNQDTIATLAQYYYAEVYSGSPSDKGFSKAFREWLDRQTGGLLKESIDALDDFTDDMVVSIATTIYFKGSWSEEFNKAATAEEEFDTNSGKKNVPFMHNTENMLYYEGDGFKAVSMPFSYSSDQMWILLPDEGISPEDLYNKRTVWEFLKNYSQNDAFPVYSRRVSLSVPKFDITTDTDLVPILKSIGINDAFDKNNADLGNLTQSVQAYVDSVKHTARVKIDEEGCEAAAFTVISVNASGMIMEDPLEFKADRPFAFVIAGADGSPLFMGIVNDPQ